MAAPLLGEAARWADGADHAGHQADEISFLIETQWFDERDACDRRAIGCAMARGLLEINPEIENQTTVLAT